MLAGIYRHYKGPLYLVLGTAHDANADTLGVLSRRVVEGEADTGVYFTGMTGREVVVYVPLMLDGAHLGPRMAVRTRTDFEVNCCVSKGCLHYGEANVAGMPRICVIDGHLWPRFEYLGESLTQEMLP